MQYDITLPDAGFQAWVAGLASNFPVVHDQPVTLLGQYLTAAGFPGGTIYWPQIFIIDRERNIQVHLSGPADIPDEATLENHLLDVLYMRDPVNLELVMDVSDSMNSPSPSAPAGDTKLQMMKQASKIIVDLIDAHGQADDRMGLVWFTDNASEYIDPVTGDKLVPVQANAVGLKAEIDLHTTGICTAMGAGLQTAFNTLMTRPDHRFSILCTDGMQNIEPKVTPVGGHFEIIDSGGWLCGAHSSTSACPGDDVALYNTPVQTIGIGIEATYATLLQDLATATGGFYRATNDPDVDLDLLYFVDLCNCMAGGSPAVVFHKAGRLYAEKPADEVLFKLNRSVRKFTAVLSWKHSQHSPLAFWLYDPYGNPVPLHNSIKHGDTYIVATVYLPVETSKAADHVGQWKMRISGDLTTSSADYHAAVIAEDHEVKFHVDYPRKHYVAGEILPLNITLKEIKLPIERIVDIQVETAYLAEPLPELLAGYQISEYELGQKARKLAEHPKDPVLLKLVTMANDPEFQSHLKPVRSTLSLAKGTLKLEVFEEELRISIKLRHAGLQTFKVMIQAETSKNGPIQRVDLISVLVHPGIPDLKHTIVSEVTRTSPRQPERLLRVTPRTSLGHLIGPGHAQEFSLVVAGKVRRPIVDDLLDGSYQVEVAASKEQPPDQPEGGAKTELWYGEQRIYG